MKDLSFLEKRLKVSFKNKGLLIQALVHRSYLNEHPYFKYPHNERLEFLGDAVLELIVSEHLYKNYQRPEGELTNWRASLVNTERISEVAKELGIESYLFLSKGEAKDTGKARQIILANTFEAIVGAIYLDQGYSQAKKFVERVLISKLPYILKHKLYLDPKTRFQEIAQAKLKITPHYEVLKEWGPDHAKRFKVGVFLKDELIAIGEGTSKQEAQFEAASKALKTQKWEK